MKDHKIFSPGTTGRALRLLAVFLAALCLHGSSRALAGPAYQSVRELRASTAQGWHQTYEAHGRTIRVDVEVEVPDVDAFPILRVRLMPKRPEAVEAEWTKGLTYWSGWDEYVCRNQKCLAFVNHPGEFLCSKDGFCDLLEPYNGSEYGWETSLLLPGDMDESTIYPEKSGVTLGEAVAFYTSLTETLFPGENVRFRLSSHAYSTYESAIRTTRGREEITPCGRYRLEFQQVIKGIPVLGSMSWTFTQGLKNYKTEESLIRGGGLGDMTLADPDTDFMARMKLYQIIDVVEADVPLVSFEDAKAQFEKEIEAGLLRDVRRVELGYRAYLDGSDADVLWLMPVWTCFGSYPFDDKTEPGDWFDNPVEAFRGFAGALVVTGQYGELHDRYDLSSRRSVHPRVLKWEDVR